MQHTREQVAQVLEYNPQTGGFFWKQTGELAGWPIKEVGGYRRARLKIDGKNYYLHRLAWLLHYGKWPTHNIDHINGDGLDNRISNLRDVPQSANVRNRQLRKDNPSGTNGVSWDAARSKWTVRLKIGSAYKFLGRFSALEDAVAVANTHAQRDGYTARHGTMSLNGACYA